MNRTTIIPTTGRWVGKLCWLHDDGTVLPVIRGGDGSGEGGEGGSGDPPEGGNQGGKEGEPLRHPDGRLLTQDDITRITTREKNEGRSSATKELLKSLGVDNLEDAKAIIDRAKKVEEENLSETEKAKKDAQADREKAAKEISDAKRERLAAKVDRKLAKAEVPEDQIEDVAQLLKLEDDPSDDDIDAAIDALKERLPQLFSPAKPDPKKPPKHDPGKPPKGGESKDSKADARSILERRHPKTVKKQDA